MTQITICFRKYSFLLTTMFVWLTLCVPQNVVHVVMNFNQPQNSTRNMTDNLTENFTCYKAHESLKIKVNFWVDGILVTALGCFGIIGNIFAVLILNRLASKSGFNRLLCTLGKV